MDNLLSSFGKGAGIIGPQAAQAMNQGQPTLNQVSQQSPSYNPNLTTPSWNPMPNKSPMSAVPNPHLQRAIAQRAMQQQPNLASIAGSSLNAAPAPQNAGVAGQALQGAMGNQYQNPNIPKPGQVSRPMTPHEFNAQVIIQALAKHLGDIGNMAKTEVSHLMGGK